MQNGDGVLQHGFGLDLPLNGIALRMRSWIPAGLFVLMTLMLLAVAPGFLRVGLSSRGSVTWSLLLHQVSLPVFHLHVVAVFSYSLGPAAHRLPYWRIHRWQHHVVGAGPCQLHSVSRSCEDTRKMEDNWLSFVLLLGTVLYGGALGFAVLPDHQAALKSLVAWLGPMAFAACVYLNWRSFPTFKQAIDRAALGGLLVVGIYGVLQFILRTSLGLLVATGNGI